MTVTPFSAALQSAKGNVLESIEFRITKVSKQIPFGEGTLQNTTCVDAQGTEMTVAWMDRDLLDNTWEGRWCAAVSTPGHGNMSGKLFGVVIGEYQQKKRIEIKAKADIFDIDPPANQPRQRPAAQQPQQQTGQRRPADQQAERPYPNRQPAPHEQAPQRQQPEHRQAPPQQTISVRTWAAKVASVQQAAMDAAVHLAHADKARHGIVRSQEQVAALSTSIFIELTRKVDWSSIQVADLSMTRPPALPLCRLYNDAPQQTDNYGDGPITEGMDGDDIPF